jgi:hypothetical protein
MASKISDVVIIKGGPSVNGEVLVKLFTLITGYGTLKLKKSEILAVEYKNPPFTDRDEVQTHAGTRIPGDLRPEVVPVRLEGTTQILKIPKTDIHSLIFFTGQGRASAATRKALRAVA